jgi:RHS repeat-associated protein
LSVRWLSCRGRVLLSITALCCLIAISVGAATATATEPIIYHYAKPYVETERISDNREGRTEDEPGYTLPAGDYAFYYGYGGNDGDEQIEEACEKGNLFEDCIGLHIHHEHKPAPLPPHYKRFEHLAVEDEYGGIHVTTIEYYAWKPVKRRHRPRHRERLGLQNAAAPHVVDPCEGKPVDCATGNEVETQTDIDVPALGVPFALERTYNSQAAETASSAGLFGYGWSSTFGEHLEFSSEPDAVTVVQANGSTAEFTGEPGVPGELTAPPWVEAKLVYTSEHTYQYTLPDQETLTFDSSGRLLSESERNGNVTTVSYHEEERCEGGCHKVLASIRIADPAGRTITLALDSSGQVETATDPMGHVIHYGYEGEDLVSVTEPGESSPRWRYGYNASHQLVETLNGLGGKTTEEYNGEGQVVKQTDALGDTLRFGYEEVASKLGGYRAAALWDESPEEEAEEVLSPSEEEAATEGATIEEEGVLLEGARFYAPPPEQETTITNEATGAVERERFNDENELVSITHAAGSPLSSTETFTYNSDDERTSASDGDKHTTEYGYDAEGDLTSEKNALGHETKWEYNSHHELTAVTAPSGEKTTIERDSHGNPIKVSRPAAGETTQATKYAYKSNGELESMTDPLGHEWKYEYNSNGDRTAAIDPEGNKRTWSYNEDSQAVSTVSPRGNASGSEPSKYETSFERDAQGRVTAVTAPEAHGASRPVDRSAATVSGIAAEGQTLSAGTGVWGGTPTLSYTYQWQACNAAGGECFEVPGLTEASLHLSSEAVGYTLRVAVTAKNSLGSATSTSAASGVVGTVAQPVFAAAFGSPGGGNGEFSRPSGVAVDAHGDVWVVDSYDNRLEKFSASGTWLASYGSFGSGSGEFEEPVEVAIDRSTGKVFVTDLGNRRVDELSEGGEWVRSWTGGEGEFEEANGIAVDSKGDVWVTDYAADDVREFNEKGELLRKFGSAGSGDGQFEGAAGIVVANGLVYVADLNNARLEAFSETGAYEGQGGSFGVGANEFEYPAGLAANSSGDIFVADLGNDRVQELSAYGDFLTAFGAAGTGAGELSEPEALAVGPEGELFVTDAGNNRVEKWLPAGKPANLAHPAVGGQLLSGQTSTAAVGAWTASPSPSYAYQWQRCSATGSECANISGATSATYTLASGDVGKTIRVKVTATNTGGSTEAVSSVSPPVEGSARTTHYGYDADGNLETLTSPDGATTTYSYNAEDEPTKVEEPDGTVTETAYDSSGQLVSQTDGAKHTTEYVRNVLGQVVESVDPLKRKTSYEYDAAGNLVKVTDPLGRTTTNVYDAANRLSETKYSGEAGHIVKYEYNADGQPTKMTDATGESTYSYDQLGRMTETKDGHGDTVAYEYDLADQPTKITYPGGKALSRAYDNDGRLHSLKDWLGNTTSFEYDRDSDLAATVFPEGTGEKDSYAYNEADEPTEVKMSKGSETLAAIAYARNNEGQLQAAAATGLPGEESTGYEYDPAGRLTQAGEAGYEYNAANDPTELGAATASYDADGELKTSTGNEYAYNEAGERTKTTPTSGPATSYSYDQAGDLTTVNRPEEGATHKIEDTYAYNGEGLRTSETISGSTKYLTWDQAEPLPLLLSNGTDSFVYGPGGLAVEQINNSTSTVTYLHHDQAGSARLITGSTGKVEGKCSYSAYGVPTCEGTATTPLGYDGQYTSSDTGLVYMRNRVYDPQTAQFLTRDPLEAITGEPYSYAEDNPLNEADPTGLISLEEGLPCYGYCGPPPSLPQAGKEVVEGAEWLGKGVAEGAKESYEGVQEGVESLINWAKGGEASNENSSPGENACGESAEERGKKLRREGEELLGRKHSPSARERWQEWYDELSKGDRRLYRKYGGPPARGRN